MPSRVNELPHVHPANPARPQCADMCALPRDNRPGTYRLFMTASPAIWARASNTTASPAASSAHTRRGRPAGVLPHDGALRSPVPAHPDSHRAP